MNISVLIINTKWLCFLISPSEIGFDICDFQGVCPFHVTWHRLFQGPPVLLSMPIEYAVMYPLLILMLVIYVFFLHSHSVLRGVWMGSQGCENKLPQMQWLKTTEMYPLNFGSRKSEMSLTGPKSRCPQGWFLLEARGENPFLASSGFWWVLAYDQLMVTSLKFLTSLSHSSSTVPLPRPPARTFRIHPDNSG